MIKINLLREGRGAARATPAPSGVTVAAGPANLNLIILLALVAVGVLIGGGWTLLKWREVAGMKREVASREEEAAKLRKIIQEVEQFEKRRDSLAKRIALINQLKQNQKGPVRLLDHISRDLPDLVWLDRMALAGTQVHIAGRTLNPNAAATFVENIKSDPMFDEPEFNVLTSQRVASGVNVYTFDMRFNFRNPQDPAATEEGAAAPAGTGAAPQGGAPQS
ncbi:MAG TPA: PilN domain-containing protein [Thermoanaerobaculia bacterium]|nr:PilN domain-containing protein [Thermoanaerobaculia bacterium]